MLPDSGTTPEGLALPVAERYCTDLPATDTALAVGLYSSTKSFLYVAPEFPPPPYTSLMTRPVPAGLADAAGMSPSGAATSARVAAATPPRTRRCALVTRD